MTRPSTPPILHELRSPSSPASLVTALRALKNELIGHDQKKEMWIGLGVLTFIARILNTHKVSGKRSHGEHGGIAESGHRSSRADDEEARLQAVIIVGSLAHGGPAYVPPLHAGAIFSPLLHILSPAESSPTLVLAVLRALNTMADAIALERPHVDSYRDAFLEELYRDEHLSSLAQILEQGSSAVVVQQQITLAAALVTKTCAKEPQRKLLALSGVLEALADRLASFIVVSNLIFANSHGKPSTFNCDIPPATTRSRLSPILQAIGTVILDSKPRTTQFVCAPAFAAVFPRPEADQQSWRATSSKLNKNAVANQSADPLLHPQKSHGPHDSFPQTSRFPPLGAGAASGKQSKATRGFSSALEVIPTEGFDASDEGETPLFAWLFHIVRAESGVTRLMASWVLTSLYRSGLANFRRETDLAQQIVPLLVQMLDHDPKMTHEIPPSYDNSALYPPDRVLMRYAPRVLAMLVADSAELQQAASDAGVIKKLSQLIKRSYDPLSADPSSMWTPDSSTPHTSTSSETPSASKIGLKGLSPQALHVLQMRESVLNALAAMAAHKDEYRKSIIDSGVVPFMIESLKPYPSTSPDMPTTTSQTSEDKPDLAGNPASVLRAACAAAKALSRSVVTLRTSLIDAGLAAPLYVLLSHSVIEVQIDATGVICNLVLEFSPMREAIIEAGVLKVLCDHAHSMNAEMRKNSVWALKHMVYSAPNDLKVKCLEELGPGWLKHLICNDMEDAAAHSSGYRGIGMEVGGAGTPIAMSTPNAAGEQVDLLNAVEVDSAPSSHAEDEDDEDEVNMIDSIGALSKPEGRLGQRRVLEPKKHSLAVDRHRLAMMHDEEVENAAQARREDIAVQEQGLELIRNVICGPGAPEMIDYLFREMGQDKFFDILASRLRPRVVDAFNRDRRSANGVKHIAPPTEIIVAVMLIIVHIAAGQPRHRQLLISQSDLLKLIVPLFNHENQGVRSSCTWLVINLTWTDDQSDKLHCKSRAYELRKLGVVERLECLESDPEMDIRERTKSAIMQMRELLR